MPGPLVCAAHDGRRRVVAAADAQAQTLGIRPGLPLARAQALVPGLVIVEAEPAADAAALTRLAAWCLRYAPLVGTAAPDGLWLDVTGCTHLAGGEAALLADLLERLHHAGFAARSAMADTPGAACAVVRFAADRATIVPTGADAAAFAPLPVRALRLADDLCDALRRLGFEELGQLLAAPRAPLVRRFGAGLALRLDQLTGAVFESIHPITPADAIERRLAFVEPIGTAEAFSAAIDRLIRHICTRLDRASLGARRLDLCFERVDRSVQAIRVGMARPSRDAAHLSRLLREQLERVDPGDGVEAMHLVAATAEPLAFAQIEAEALGADASANADIAMLVDRLVNRLGPARVYRMAPAESDVPERSVQAVVPLAPAGGTSWPSSLRRPVRLLARPQPVMAMAPLPDHAPAAFTWRRVRHRIRHADGPERITGEWWKRDGEVQAVRDYFAVEDEAGQRFWLFRRGDGADPETGDLSWFLHGFF